MDDETYRPLTAQEREVLTWLLRNGPANASSFLPQLDVIQARSSCKCGCPSIGFSVPLESPQIGTPPVSMTACFTGKADGYEVGLVLWAGAGCLTDLDVYTFGEADGPFGLPSVESLKVADSKPSTLQAGN